MPPLVIAAGIAAAGSVASAAIQSRAAGRAADTQSRAAQDAIERSRQIYEQQRADQAPYRNAGASAVTTLGGLMGLPMSSGDANPLPAAAPRAPQDMPAGPQETGWQAIRNRLTNMPPGSSLQDLGNRVQTAQAQTGSSYRRSVRLQAPDGEIADVPEEDADFFLSRGARRVN